MKKVFFCLMISALACFMGMAAAAQEADVTDNTAVLAANVVDSGTCGKNLTWTLYDDGELFIDGSGEMSDYSYEVSYLFTPWYYSNHEQKIKKVIFGDEVTHIGDWAFYNCSALTSVELSNISSIGKSAFRNCSSLTSINSDKVSFIREYTFYGCSSLKSVSLANGFYMGNNNTKNESTLTSDDNTYSTSSEVEIKDNSNGNTVTSGTTRLSFTIGTYAFQGCPLTFAKLANVSYIGYNAFSGTILNSVDLTNAYFSIDEFKSSGLYYKNLVNIIVDDDNTVYSMKDGILFNKDKTILIRCPVGLGLDSYTVPDTVSSIKESAFSMCSGLTSINFSNVSSIGSNAFYRCSGITVIDLANASFSTADFLNSGLFNNMFPADNLNYITVNDDNTVYSTMDGILFDKNKTVLITCPRKLNLGKYTVPNTVSSIASYAFSGCTGLTSIDFANVSSIGFSAFSGCTGLTSVDFANVSSIHISVFRDCTRLKFVDLANLSSIEDSAFYGCSELVAVNSANVSSIGNFAFYGCSSLAFVDFTNVSSIGNSAFYGCSGLASVDFANVSGIGHKAFYGCTNLTSITIDETNQYYCVVDNVLFNADITELILYPSNNPTADYVIPESVQYVAYWTFIDCTGLTSIIVPENMWMIPSFENCSNLIKAVIHSKEIEYSETPQAFKSCHSNLTLYCYPDSTTEAYAIENNINYAYINAEDITLKNTTESDSLSITTATVNGTSVRILRGLTAGTTVPQLLEYVQAPTSDDSGNKLTCTLKITDRYGESINGNAVSSGCVMQAVDTDGNVVSEVMLIVTGDVNGDGKASLADTNSVMKGIRALLEGKSIDDVYYVNAADLDGDGSVTCLEIQELLMLIAGADAETL